MFSSVRNIVAGSSSSLLSRPLLNHSIFVRTATKKAGGSTKNGRDSNPKVRRIHDFLVLLMCRFCSIWV
jgi:hypothetical protein